MEPRSSTPKPQAIPPGGRPTPNVAYKVDYQIRPRPGAHAGAGASAGDHHDDTLVPAALQEIETQRAQVEQLLEAGVLGNCLSD
jgi:hypothetical protein